MPSVGDLLTVQLCPVNVHAMRRESSVLDDPDVASLMPENCDRSHLPVTGIGPLGSAWPVTGMPKLEFKSLEACAVISAASALRSDLTICGAGVGCKISGLNGAGLIPLIEFLGLNIQRTKQRPRNPRDPNPSIFPTTRRGSIGVLVLSHSLIRS
jgi:hypothetical protein